MFCEPKFPPDLETEAFKGTWDPPSHLGEEGRVSLVRKVKELATLHSPQCRRTRSGSLREPLLFHCLCGQLELICTLCVSARTPLFAEGSRPTQGTLLSDQGCCTGCGV